MDLDPKDIADGYKNMPEGELLKVAHSYESLTETAQAALRAEFAHRNLEPPIIEQEEAEPERRKLVTLCRYRDLSEAIVART